MTEPRSVLIRIADKTRHDASQWPSGVPDAETTPLSDAFPFNKRSPVSGQTARVRLWQALGCLSFEPAESRKTDFPDDNTQKNSGKAAIAGNLACV